MIRLRRDSSDISSVRSVFSYFILLQRYIIQVIITNYNTIHIHQRYFIIIIL